MKTQVKKAVHKRSAPLLIIEQREIDDIWHVLDCLQRIVNDLRNKQSSPKPVAKHTERRTFKPKTPAPKCGKAVKCAKKST